MKHIKVWAVLGEDGGLGLAAIKYLISKKQIVIVLTDINRTRHPFFGSTYPNLFFVNKRHSNDLAVRIMLKRIKLRYGAVDCIINNGNFRIFDNAELQTREELMESLSRAVDRTENLISTLSPYLRREPKASLINIPPQLCLATIKDPQAAQRLSAAMTSFLGLLELRLRVLDCELSFLHPDTGLTAFND